jgi:alpha-D-xyloside xylohydrolase
MKSRKAIPGGLFRLISFLVFSPLIANAQTFQKIPGGVVVKPANGSARAVRISVLSDKIIRVNASADELFKRDASLSVIPQTQKPVFTVLSSATVVQLKTKAITASISLSNGTVSFATANGKPLLSELSNGRKFTPSPVDGEKQYSLYQAFSSSEEEGLYGLGQHQEGVMNYKGTDVLLLQQNSDVAVPFLLSSKHYGLLWDNYSITKFGDTRDQQQLSAFNLYDKDGNAGALTASYNLGDSVFVRREPEINSPYLNSLTKYPAGVDMGKATVYYDGSIEAKETGLHTFHLYSGGYIKLWIDGKLWVDTWRQSWNPESSRLPVPLEAGKKTSIKIEWRPESNEPYIRLTFLPPLPANGKNQYAFASEAGDIIDYYFVYGNNADEVISGYRKLTGKATLIPKWALGFWQSRERYKTQEEILTTVAEFRRRGIGLDNIVEDWSYWKQDQWGSHEFDETRFPDAAGMIKTLHEKYHAQIMISVWPKYYTNTANYADMNAKGYLYKRNVEIGRRDWIGKGYTSTFYDSYNAGARAAFWKQINEKLFSKGIDAWWMDASEPDIHSNVSIEDRKDFMNPTALGNSTKYFNGYALQNAKGIYEGQRSADASKRVFILTRSAFAGMQRYAAATWSGDIGARWRDMRNQISAGLNFCMSGLPYWTMDVGGFAVEHRYEHPNEADKAEWQEQITRWYQYGAFAPLFRVHGQFPFREIYNTAPDDHPAYKSMLYYNKLRYRLMPYIYSLAGNTYQKDYTLMRALVMDFDDDKNVKNIDDQFMFGPAFLVNPVSEYKATNRQLYLPKGGWYNAYNGVYTDGGKTITAEAPYERMPLFVRAGSIVPLGPAVQYTMQKQPDTLTVFVYAGKNGSFSLYEDEGINYNYEKGKFSTINFTWNDAAGTLQIGQRNGSFNGMLTTRLIRVVLVSSQHSAPLDAETTAADSVIYSGKPVTITIKKQ